MSATSNKHGDPTSPLIDRTPTHEDFDITIVERKSKEWAWRCEA
jgi:hypothetical protein